MSTCAHIAVLARSERILNVVLDLRGFSQAEVKQEPRINLAKDEAENMLLWGRSLQLPLGVVGRGRSLQLPLGVVGRGLSLQLPLGVVGRGRSLLLPL